MPRTKKGRVERQYDELIKFATALRLGIADAESILRRLTKNNFQSALATFWLLIPNCSSKNRSFDGATESTIWSKSCLVADSTDRTPAAMIASESKERAKQPKPCSHQNHQSADPPFRIRPELIDGAGNRACWQLRLRRRPLAKSSKRRSAPRRRPRARSRRRNLRGSALW
jgi:Tn3 transposase DDE domain